MTTTTAAREEAAAQAERALLGPEGIEDPFPIFARLRESDPVRWSAKLEAFLVSRYQDVLAAFKDPRLSSRRADRHIEYMPAEIRAEMDPFRRSMGLWAFFQDPPDHTRLRALIVRTFTTRLVEGMRASIVEVVDRLLEPGLRRGSMDFVREFTYPLPAVIISRMLGVAEEDVESVKRWSYDIAHFLASRSRAPEVGLAAARSWREMTEHMKGIVASRRSAGERDPARPAPGEGRSPSSGGNSSAPSAEVRRPGGASPPDRHEGDLISELIAAEEAGAVESEDELLAQTVLTLFAGHETTTHLIGNALAALLSEPGRLEELAASPELIPSAVEELLRFAGPLQIMSRIAKEPLEVGGRAIPQGGRLMLLLGAANRDPEQFRDPERLDLRRDPNRHVAFGYGPHFCVGAPLARLEAEIALRAFLARAKNVRREDGPLEWHQNVGLRGLVRLPLRLEARP